MQLAKYVVLLPVSKKEYKRIQRGAQAVLREDYPRRNDAYPLDIYLVAPSGEIIGWAMVTNILPVFMCGDEELFDLKLTSNDVDMVATQDTVCWSFSDIAPVKVKLTDFLVLNSKKRTLTKLEKVPSHWRYAVLNAERSR